MSAFGIIPTIIAYGLVSRARWPWSDPLNIWTHQVWAWTASVVLGIALILWIVVETILLGYQSFLQPAIVLLGAFVIIPALWPSVRKHLAR